MQPILMENPIQLQVIADSLHNRLQNNAVHVPQLPQVVTSCLQVSRTPGAKPEQLHALITGDQRLVDGLMRVCRTGLFGSFEGADIAAVVVHLGQQTIADLTLALSLNAGLFNAPGHTQYVVEQLRQAILCGLWSRQVALLRRRQIEAAMICGVCKSIGRPVVIEAALDCAVRHRMHLSYQDLMILADQFEYGATQKVLATWQMPEVVHAVATHWLDYRNAGEAREQTMTSVAGARLASVCSKGENPSAREILARDRVFTDLGISGKQLDQLCELRRSGEIVRMEPQVFDLLVHLVRNRDRIVSKDDLIADQTGYSPEAREKAAALVHSFEQYLTEHKEEFYALSHRTGATRRDTAVDVDGRVREPVPGVGCPELRDRDSLGS